MASNIIEVKSPVTPKDKFRQFLADVRVAKTQAERQEWKIDPKWKNQKSTFIREKDSVDSEAIKLVEEVATKRMTIDLVREKEMTEGEVRDVLQEHREKSKLQTEDQSAQHEITNEKKRFPDINKVSNSLKEEMDKTGKSTIESSVADRKIVFDSDWVKMLKAASDKIILHRINAGEDINDVRKGQVNGVKPENAEKSKLKSSPKTE